MVVKKRAGHGDTYFTSYVKARKHITKLKKEGYSDAAFWPTSPNDRRYRVHHGSWKAPRIAKKGRR